VIQLDPDGAVCKHPESGCGSAHDSVETSIFCIFIIASNTRFAAWLIELRG